MFGLDKIFGGKGLLGGFFDKIGMPWMNNVLSLATNVATGNWLGAAKDVFGLVSQFSNSWMNKVDRFQPLGQFGKNSCFGNDSLSTSRMQEIGARARRSDAVVSSKARNAINLVQRSVEDRTMITANLRNASVLAQI